MNPESMAKKIEIMEETYELQLRLQQSLLQQCEQYSRNYEETLKQHTRLLREQFMESLKEYSSQQTRKYLELESAFNDKVREIERLREEHKSGIQHVHRMHQEKHDTTRSQLQIEFEQMRAEDRKQIDDLKELNAKQGCAIQLLRQQLADQTVEHSKRLVQLKQCEETITSQINQIKMAERKINDQAEEMELWKNKYAIVTERLQTLNVPEDFVEKEKELLSKIKVLERQLDISERAMENWKKKYSLIEGASRRKK